MGLQGTLDVFGVDDVLLLLARTRKTGALHLQPQQAVESSLWLREGAVVGAREGARASLVRRLLAAGLAGDDDLAALLQETDGIGIPTARHGRVAPGDLRVGSLPEADSGTPPLAQRLAEQARVPPDVLREVAEGLVTDLVADAVGWRAGDFCFRTQVPCPDDVGARLEVGALLDEAGRRAAARPALEAALPDRSALLSLAPAPVDLTGLSRDEWALLAAADGRTSVEELLARTDSGRHELLVALVGLLERSVVRLTPPAVGRPTRGDLLARLEGGASVLPAPGADPASEPARLPAAAPEPARLPPAAPEPAPAAAAAPEPAPAAAAAPAPASGRRPADPADRVLLLRLLEGSRAL